MGTVHYPPIQLRRLLEISDVFSNTPETPGTLTNEQVRANQEPALTETNSVPREQSAPPEQPAYNQEPTSPTEEASQEPIPDNYLMIVRILSAVNGSLEGATRKRHLKAGCE